MIQLLCWIYLLQLLAPALSDNKLYTDSVFSNDVSTTVDQPESTKKSVTEAAINFTTEVFINIASDLTKVNTGSEQIYHSNYPSEEENAESTLVQKFSNPTFGIITKSDNTQTFEDQTFEMNTKYQFAQKAEDLSLGMITNPAFRQNSSPTFVMDTEPIHIRQSEDLSTEDAVTSTAEQIHIRQSEDLSTEDTMTSDTEPTHTRQTEDFSTEDTMTSDTEQIHIRQSEDLSTEDTTTSPTMSTTTKFTEPLYSEEMTITYKSTTANLKETANNTNQIETSTLPYSTKILYFDDKKNTEKETGNIVINKSSPISIPIIFGQSTLSEPIFSEKSSKPTLSEAETTTLSAIKSSPNNNKFTTAAVDRNAKPIFSRLSIKTSVQRIKSPYKSAIAILSAKDGPHIRNSRTAFENLQSSSNDSQTQTFIFGPTTTEVPETVSPKDIDIDYLAFKKIEENLGNAQITKNTSDNETKNTQTPNTHEILANEVTTTVMDDILDNLSEDATETNNNATRNPKKIQENEEFEERYPEGRVRPIHPDPGYANYPEKDIVRPYRPDVPLHKYPYYRPTPDSRTPIIKEDKDYTRPSRPESEYPRVSFRPSYLHSKTSQDDISPMPISVFATSPNPYKPSFNRPAYHPQSSFGRPYRPDYHRPSSKPTDDYSVTKISEIKGGPTQEADVSEHSRADYDYTRLSEMLSTYTKIYNSDTRPSATSSDLTKSYGPTYDAEISMHSKATSPDDLMSAIREMAKVSKPDMNTNRPSSYYPRPGFGNNYQASDTSVKPFSVGTVTSAKNLTRVEFIKADCFDNHMKVTMRFNGTFNGLVYSSGYASDSSCSYVNGSGRNHYEFYIRLNRCGTLGQQEVTEQRMRSLSPRRRQERAQYLVNTVTVQYNPVIEEDIDEHFRVTCEYGYDFWKTVTFPVMSVESSAVKVRTGSPVVFTLPPPQCNMEIRNGFGPSGTRVSGPVNVGDPLTLVIHMKSESTGFDILVKNCYAHNGAQKRLQLIDSNGCVVQEKLVSAFRGVHSPDRSQQITLYSYLKAFRFTGSPALYIECDVHMCHGSCPPQRCYWRHMYKRSANEVTTEVSTTTENVMSESVSLFQALEVRHDEVDSPYLLSLKTPSGIDSDDVVCLKTSGFGAILACLLLLLITTSFSAVIMCLRMRKMKKLIEAPHSRRFVEFDGHVPK